MTAPYILDTPPAPGTPEWTAAITASKVPAMIRTPDGEFANLGYLSAWETYEQLKGRYTPEHSDYMLARFQRAHDEERPACEWWVSQQDNPDDWMLSAGEVAFHNPAYPFLDFVTIDCVATHLPTGHRVRLEVKNPDFPGMQPGWFFQSVAQEAGSGLPGGIIISPVNGEREWHRVHVTPDNIATVMADVADFRRRLDEDDAPADGDKQIAADLLARLRDAKEAEKLVKAALAEVKADIERALGINKRLMDGNKVIAYRSAGRFAQGRVDKEHAAALEDPDVFTTVATFDVDKFKAKYPDLYDAAVGSPTVTIK